MADLLLDTDWDITVDRAGNMALAGEDYSVAQAVGNEIKLIFGEGWYDPGQGLPISQIMSSPGVPDLSLIRSLINAAAQGVMGVTDAETILRYDRGNRTLGGDVLVTTVTGATLNVTI